jgi:hypothetical protein
MMKPPSQSKPPPPAARPAKTFSVAVLSGKKEGRKIVLYGGSGKGKTTLGALAPNPVYIPIDDGARMIQHPKTGHDLRGIEGITDFQDLRDALHQPNLFTEGDTLVLDTITKAEVFGEAWTLQHVKTEKGGLPENIEAYGYGKGYRHLLDTMRLLESDLEPLVRRGVNVLLLAQQGNVKIANPEGLDYIQEAPKLVHTNNASVMGEFFEWADDVFRISFSQLNVVAANPRATKGKATGSSERVIYTAGGLHFMAKTRMATLPPVVSFSEPKDDSLWQFLFHGAKAGAE